jgi:hypothetical protein
MARANKTIVVVAIIMAIVVLAVALTIYYMKINNENFDQQNCKIAITTSEDRDYDYIAMHDKNFQEYCNKHGYDYVRMHNEVINNQRVPVYWYKIQLVDKLLNSGKYCYVMWADSDSLVMNPEFKIEDIVSSGKDIYIGTDYGFPTYNAGLFIIKNSETGRKFVKELLLKLNDKSCFSEDYTKIVGAWAGPCYEQGHMNKVIKERYRDNAEIISQKLFHNTPTIYIQGPFIIHVYAQLSEYLLPMIYGSLKKQQ